MRIPIAMAGKSLALSAVTLATLMAPAFADPRPLASSGLWSAYADTTADNRALCGIVTVGGDGRRIAIEQVAGQSGLTLSLSKNGWSIPGNTGIDLRFQFDLDDQIPARATGAGQAVTVGLTFDQSIPFMRALRSDRQIRVFFPNGNEPAWTGGLAGSSRSIDAFNDCRARLGPSQPTQPFSPQPGSVPAPVTSAPTQPFSGTAPPALPDAPSPALAPTGNPTDLPPLSPATR